MQAPGASVKPLCSKRAAKRMKPLLKHSCCRTLLFQPLTARRRKLVWTLQRHWHVLDAKWSQAASKKELELHTHTGQKCQSALQIPGWPAGGLEAVVIHRCFMKGHETPAQTLLLPHPAFSTAHCSPAQVGVDVAATLARTGCEVVPSSFEERTGAAHSHRTKMPERSADTTLRERPAATGSRRGVLHDCCCRISNGLWSAGGSSRKLETKPLKLELSSCSLLVTRLVTS